MQLTLILLCLQSRWNWCCATAINHTALASRLVAAVHVCTRTFTPDTEGPSDDCSRDVSLAYIYTQVSFNDKRTNFNVILVHHHHHCSDCTISVHGSHISTRWSLGPLPDTSWRQCPGRPCNRWLDQLRRDNGTPPADLWRRAITHGHPGLMLWSSTTMC